MSFDVVIDPVGGDWPALIERAVDGGGEAGGGGEPVVLGRPMDQWRSLCRPVLGLPGDVPIVATGHQSLLWHPGILAKYIAIEAFVSQRAGWGASGGAMANLIVDQHADGWGAFDVPIRRVDGSLAVRRVELTQPRPGVPMALHEAFSPAGAPRLSAALPEVGLGVDRVFELIASHRSAANASMQMALALADMMSPWVGPMPQVTSTALLETGFSRALFEHMVSEPQQCAKLYNAAVGAVPEAGIGRLLVRDDYVELPLWRIAPDGRRMRAYDSDVERWLERGDLTIMPRALLMTALIRLIMCDLFIHGTGGARYDRAMEHWIKAWLGVTPAPIAVVSADVRLPLHDDHEPITPKDIDILRHAARRAWHDPMQPRHGGPSSAKQELLDAIADAPQRSLERRRAFYEMHNALAKQREQHADDLRGVFDAVDRAGRALRDQEIAQRRDWAFALYSPELIDQLNEDIAQRFSAGCRS